MGRGIDRLVVELAPVADRLRVLHDTNFDADLGPCGRHRAASEGNGCRTKDFLGPQDFERRI